jgi:hypothetical protein
MERANRRRLFMFYLNLRTVHYAHRISAAAKRIIVTEYGEGGGSDEPGAFTTLSLSVCTQLLPRQSMILDTYREICLARSFSTARAA